MKKRFLTGILIAVVYVGAVLLSLLLHPVFFDVFTVLLMLSAAYEVMKAIGPRYGEPIAPAVFVEILVGYLGFFLIQYFLNGGGVAVFTGVLLVTLGVCAIYVRVNKMTTRHNLSSTLLVLVYPVTVLVYMLGLNYLPDVFRIPSILLLFIISTLTDTFAYLIG